VVRGVSKMLNNASFSRTGVIDVRPEEDMRTAVGLDWSEMAKFAGLGADEQESYNDAAAVDGFGSSKEVCDWYRFVQRIANDPRWVKSSLNGL